VLRKNGTQVFLLYGKLKNPDIKKDPSPESENYPKNQSDP
jgi:hypothetical protein